MISPPVRGFLETADGKAHQLVRCWRWWGHTFIKETQVFPRFHQWQAVTRMVDALRTEGVGQPYCIQHSAGSGKTNTIAWTAYALIRLRHADGTPYFHSVIVVTDRQVLDKQLQDAITQIEHQSGVVRAIDRETSSLPKSQQLAQAMLDGPPVIVCTVQTFPHAQKAILGETSLSDRRFAVIIDEAHSSTGGSTADDLRYVLTGKSESGWSQLGKDERLCVWQSSRQRPPNISYFAFTAVGTDTLLEYYAGPAPTTAMRLACSGNYIEDGTDETLTNVTIPAMSYITVFVARYSGTGGTSNLRVTTN